MRAIHVAGSLMHDHHRVMRTIDARIVFSSLALAFFSMVGCDDAAAPSSSPAAAEKSPPKATEPPKLIDVKYALEVKPPAAEGRDGTATWSVTVPTGGWKMTTDSVLVEDWNGAPAVRVFVTLEQPGAGEMVSQAFQTLSDSKAGKNVTKAEFSVRRKIRGVDDSTFPQLYSVVKMVPESGW